MRRTLTVIVNNQPGVLNRTTGLFLRKAFNIESITVGETETAGVSRMTIAVNVQREQDVEQVIKQLYKQIDIIKVTDITNSPSVIRELVLIKVSSPLQNRTELTTLIQPFRAAIIDVGRDNVTIEATGSPEKVEALIDLVKPFGIRELARTGVTAFKRGYDKNAEVTKLQRNNISLI